MAGERKPAPRSLKTLGTFTVPTVPPVPALDTRVPYGPALPPPPAPLAFLAPWLEGAVDVVRGGLWGSEGAGDTAAAKTAELLSAGLPLLPLKALGFFSRVDKAVDLIPAKGAHPNKVAKLLKDNASAEEIAYRNVPQFLAGKGNATVTRAELAKHLAAHPAPVPVVKTRGSSTDPAHVYAARDLLEHGATPEEAMTALRKSYKAATPGELSDALFAARNPEYPVGPTKFGTYTVPGGEAYRETLVTLPPPPKPNQAALEAQIQAGQARLQELYQQAEGLRRRGPDALKPVWAEIEDLQTHHRDLMRELSADPPGQFRSGHFEEPNILVHTRANERTLPTGERGRFVEEVQSDWHQKGEREGYALASGSPERMRLEAERAAASAAHTATADALSEAKNRWKYGTGNPEREALDRQLYGAKARPLSGSEALEAKTRQDVLRAEDLRRVEAAEQANNAAWQTYKALDDQLRAGVPDAPFKETWPDLGLKQQVLETAADPNAEWIGFTGGATQAARYDLSKQVSHIDYRRTKDGLFELGAVGIDGDPVSLPKSAFRAEELPAVVGKELAEKVVAGQGQPGGGRMTLRGVDLQVGGEGMEHFYDRLLPKRLEKILKPFGGGPVERTNVAMQPAWFAKLTPEMKARILKEGLPLMSLLPLGVLGQYGQAPPPEDLR